MTVEFIIFCIAFFCFIYVSKKEMYKKQKTNNSYNLSDYDFNKNTITFERNNKNNFEQDEPLNKFVPSVKTKYSNCIKFVSNKLKFKYIVSGDFYFVQNSSILIKEANVFNYKLFANINNKGYIEIAKYKEKRGTTINKLDEDYKDWILLINKITRLSKNKDFQSIYYDNKMKVNICFCLDIYHNGKLVKTIPDYFNVPNVNMYGEILYNKRVKNGDAINKFSIIKNLEKNVIKNDRDGTLNQSYSIDFSHFPELEYNMYDKNGNVCIYFYKKECDSFYIVSEFCKNADDFFVLPNKFEDDIETINYCAKFKQNRVKDIAFLSYALDRTLNLRCAFSKGLYGDKVRNNTCGGTAVYKIPMMDYYKGLEGKYASMNEASQHFLTLEQKQNFKTLVKTIYEKYNLRNNTNSPCINPAWNTFDEYLSEIKTQYNDMKQLLIEQGVIKKKWKSEVELLRTVHSVYPDCIYQYRAKWLGLQSLDIFIPSLNLGIEYQGLQHYESVILFGGDVGFKHRQKLDKQTVQLCKEHGVKLIEWRYDETISKL